MNRFEEDDEAFSRRRRRGNSPSSYRIGIGGGGGGGRHWEGDGPGEGVGGFRQMNGPPERIDFHPRDPRHDGSLPPMGFAFDGGFWPMSPNGSVGGEEKRSIVGADGGGGGFRHSGQVKFPPSESPDGGRFIGKVMESDYSVRLTQPPVQPSLSGQKRGHHSLSEHDSFTGNDGSDHSIVKLFVGSVPRTATEEEVRPLFEQHGNVLEVALIKDKRTGQQQGCCFVKYATSSDADRAIRALHNQITLPGGTGPVQVRYADGERERIGALEFKLFVGSLNKQATEKEVEEIFLQFGHLEDVYLMRDESRQSRGCGFVKYSSKETALAAINGLNGTYTMRGCSQPLIVRFADPKRPKPGESRDMAPPVGLSSGPRFQASGPRPTSKLGDRIGDVSHSKSWRPTNLPNIGPPTNTGIRGIGSDFSSRPGQATLPSNKGGPLGDYGVPPLNPLPLSGGSSSATSQQQNRAAGQKISPLQKPLHSPQDIPLRPQSYFPGVQASLQNPYGYSSQLPTSHLPQQNITPATTQTNLNINLRPTTVSSATDQFPPRVQQQPLQNMQHPPSELAKLLSQQTQSLQATLQSSQQAISQLQQQVQSMQQPNHNLPVSQNGEAGKQQWGGPAIPKVVSTTGSTPVSYVQTAAPTVSQSVVSVKCNWTEHTSPDGFKYYYNCLTGESKWEKPEEMVVFERQQHHQQKPTIHQPQTLLQPVQQPPQQHPQTQLQLIQQQPQQQPQTQLQPIQQQPQQQPQTQVQPIQQQPQEANQHYQGQQLQQPFYSSLYSTPGVSHNAQYPSLAVSQNSQFPMSGIGQNAQEYGRTHIPVGAASVNDLSRNQQSRQSPQELMWKNKARGT